MLVHSIFYFSLIIINRVTLPAASNLKIRISKTIIALTVLQNTVSSRIVIVRFCSLQWQQPTVQSVENNTRFCRMNMVNKCWSVQGRGIILVVDPQFLACYFLCDPIMTLETKLTIALAGCSGSCSAKRWHKFSVSL